MKKFKMLIMAILFCTTVQMEAVVQNVSDTTPKNIEVEFSKQIKGYGVITSLLTSDKCLVTCCQLNQIQVNITKQSENGSILWEKILGKDSTLSITNIAEVPGSGYDVLGYKTLGPSPLFPITRYAVRLNSYGDQLWEWKKYKVHSGAQDIILEDNNYNFSVFSYSVNIVDDSLTPVFRKYDSLGNQIDEVFYDKVHAGSFYASSFFKTNNNGFGVLIYLSTFDSIGIKTTYQFWILDSLGKKVKTQILPEVYENKDNSFCTKSAIQTKDNNFIIVTCSSSKNGANNIIFRRYDENGSLLLTKTYNIALSHLVNSLVEMPSGDLLIGGVCNNNSDYILTDYMVVRISPTGKLKWSEKFGDINSGDAITNLNVIDEHTFFMSGYTNAGLKKYETTSISTIMKANDLLVSGVPDMNESPSIGITLYPNPISTSFTISSSENIHSLRVLNSLGMEVISKKAVSSKQQIDVSSLVNGLYFVSMQTSSGNVVKPIVVNR